jgi:vitamin B12 transporter
MTVTTSGNGFDRRRQTARILRATVAAGGLAVAAALPAAAQTSVDEVVVTATRVPTRIEAIGSSVSVIDRQQIENRQYKTVTEALRGVPGLRMVQQGPRGANTSIFMRGSNSNQTLVLLNGQRISNPSTPTGAFNFADLTTDNVERIEVVRGPQSSLFGSDAIGGVINIITRKPGAEGVRGSVRAEAGSLETFDGSAHLNGRQGRVGFDVSLSGVTTEGDTVTPDRFRPAGVSEEDDGYRSIVGSAQVDVDVTDQVTFSLFGQATDSRIELDTAPEDPNSEEDVREVYTSAEIAGEFFQGRYRPSLTFSYSDFTRDNTDDLDAVDPGLTIQDTKNEGDRVGVTFENEIDVHPDHTLIVGGEFFDESFDSSGSTNFGGFIVNQQSDGSAAVGAVFVQDVFQLTERLSGTVGIRHDETEDFGGETTWHVAPTYRVEATGTRLKGSVGTGFKTPSLFERFGFNPTNFGTAFRGNPDLDAEKSFGWEAGFEQPLLENRVRFGATYFQLDIDDGVTTVFDAAFNSTTVNNVDIETRGVESFIAVSPIDTVDLRADYTYLLAEDADTGQTLVRRPKHKISFDAAWRVTPRATLTGGVVILSDIKDIGLNGGRVDLPDYGVVRVAGSYGITDSIDLTARVENALDRDYEVADGFKAPGLEAFAGTRIRF